MSMSPAAESLILEGENSTDPELSTMPLYGASPAAEVVARWHDDVHLGAFSTCYEQPCMGVRRVDG